MLASNDRTPSIEAQLDEALNDFAVSLHEYANGRANGLVYSEELDKAKTKLLNLIAHLASEAKPEKVLLDPVNHRHDGSTDYFRARGHDDAIDTYQNNMMKALGRET